jgi:hypothetical protein
VYLRRIIGDARAGLKVESLGDHRDLCMRSLRVVTGSAWENSREVAIQSAVSLYREAVAKGECPPELGPSVFGYEEVLRSALQLLDDTHGHELKGIKRKDMGKATPTPVPLASTVTYTGRA